MNETDNTVIYVILPTLIDSLNDFEGNTLNMIFERISFIIKKYVTLIDIFFYYLYKLNTIIHYFILSLILRIIPIDTILTSKDDPP